MQKLDKNTVLIDRKRESGGGEGEASARERVHLPGQARVHLWRRVHRALDLRAQGERDGGEYVIGGGRSKREGAERTFSVFSLTHTQELSEFQIKTETDDLHLRKRRWQGREPAPNDNGYVITKLGVGCAPLSASDAGRRKLKAAPGLGLSAG